MECTCKETEACSSCHVDDGAEWECPECGERGMYIDIRGHFERGTDPCPACRADVDGVE